MEYLRSHRRPGRAIQIRARAAVPREGAVARESGRLYGAPTSAVEGRLAVAALLTYRWSWASAVYLGLGDDRPLDATGALAPGHQQLFIKLQVARP